MRVAVPGGELAVVEHTPFAGAGPPILCLHGFPDVPSSFAPLARLLTAAGRRVVAPWLRGYHPSTLAGPFTAERLADDLLAVADAVSPGEPVDVIGHDWGALATYTACAVRPERIRRAVTLAVPHPAAFMHNVPRQPFQLRRSWYMLFFQLPHAAEWALMRRDGALIERLWHDWSPGWSPPPGHLDEVKRALTASMPAPLEVYRTMFQQVVAGARPPGRIEVPTLALHGARDGCVGAHLGDGQARFFRDLRAEIVDEVGHFLHLERPALVAERALEWFAIPLAHAV
jgi:pimeloyl-ACP methyl ester carboxylesterase